MRTIDFYDAFLARRVVDQEHLPTTRCTTYSAP